MQKVIRILSIDGGGTRGIIPATILEFIEEHTGKPIYQLFDLIAGTSTGGIIALGLTKPNQCGESEYSAHDICRLYKRDIPEIFSDPLSWWGNLLGPKYKSFAFQQILKNAFGDSRLRNVLTDVLIPSYNIEHRAPYIFKSSLAKQNSEFDFQIRDVALAASASPTLFHPVRFPRLWKGRNICLVDGGVFANNPSLSALSEIKSMVPDQGERYLVLSIGTGKSTRPLSDEFVGLWGYVHWSRPMLELVMESNSESVHEQMTHLLPSGRENQYYRLQVDLPENIDCAIDNASKSSLEAYCDAAVSYVSDETNAVKQICESLMSLADSSYV